MTEQIGWVRQHKAVTAIVVLVAMWLIGVNLDRQIATKAATPATAKVPATLAAGWDSDSFDSLVLDFENDFSVDPQVADCGATAVAGSTEKQYWMNMPSSIQLANERNALGDCRS